MKSLTSKTSKTNTMTIRAIYGQRLRLTPTRLVQIDFASDRPWYAKKEDIRRAAKSATGLILIHEVGTNKTLHVHFHFPDTSYWTNNYGAIGCCKFDGKTFKQILHRFGVRRARAAKAGA